MKGSPRGSLAVVELAALHHHKEWVIVGKRAARGSRARGSAWACGDGCSSVTASTCGRRSRLNDIASTSWLAIDGAKAKDPFVAREPAMSTDDGAAVGVGSSLARHRPDSLRARLGGSSARWVFWIVGAAIVAAAQPTMPRREAGAAAAVAGIAAVTLVRWLTESPAKRYLRSLLAGILAVSIAADWGLRIGLGSVVGGTSFLVYGEAKKIILPFLFVLLAPLVLEALPVEPRLSSIRGALASARRQMRWMDWIVLTYAVIAVPAVLIGLAHNWRLTYIAQDVGLVVFFVFLYIAGRACGGGAEVGAWAVELVDVLLLLAVAQLVFFGWNVAPLYAYVEATCAGAVALVLMRREARKAGLLRLTIAILLLGSEAVAAISRTTTASAIGLGLLMAIGVFCYLAARLRPLVPTAVLVAVTAIGVIGFVGFTHDGAALRGQYRGADQSNKGRTYEAKQVRAQVRGAPISLLFGRGFGSTIDERGRRTGS